MKEQELRKYKIDYIKKFIEFCYASLDETSLSERNKWYSLGNTLGLGVKFPYDSGYQISGEPTEEHWNALKKYQKDLSIFLEWIFKIKNKDHYVFVPITYVFTTGAEQSMTDVFDYSAKHPVSIKSDQPFFNQSSRYIKFEARSRITNKSTRHNFPPVVTEFFKASSGFFVNSFLRCPKCEKIFFNPTERKKVYCTTKCRNLAGTHRIREKSVQ